VCVHTELETVEAGLREGASVSELARRFHLTRFAIMRHRDGHKGVETTATRATRKDSLRINRNPAIPPPPPEVEADAKEHFLTDYAKSGDFLGSALAAGITRATIQVWLEHDDEFGVRFHQAKAAVVDQLEATALDRAMHGAKLIREVWRNDHLIERVIEWRPQETTLVKLLQALRPEVYAEKLQVTQTQIVKTVDADAWVAV
jgi:hypothetical protein